MASSIQDSLSVNKADAFDKTGISPETEWKILKMWSRELVDFLFLDVQIYDTDVHVIMLAVIFKPIMRLEYGSL